MNFLKSLYRKLFGIKTGSYETVITQGGQLQLWNMSGKIKPRIGITRPAYDPSQDENKIMNGEVESYFE